MNSIMISTIIGASLSIELILFIFCFCAPGDDDENPLVLFLAINGIFFIFIIISFYIVVLANSFGIILKL